MVLVNPVKDNLITIVFCVVLGTLISYGISSSLSYKVTEEYDKFVASTYVMTQTAFNELTYKGKPKITTGEEIRIIKQRLDKLEH
jgi:hypothetical protein